MKIFGQAVMAGCLVLGVATAGYTAKDKSQIVDKTSEPNYTALMPEAFGEWKLLPQIRLVVPTDDDALANRIYSQMIGRAYADKAGNTVMLLLAYGPNQVDRLQLHRPEICYVAEGFRVSGLRPTTLEVEPGRAPLEVSKMVARREGRTERITYWMRIGDHVVSTLFRRQLTTTAYGLRGVIADGVLVRVSTINLDERTAEEVQSRFIRDMLTTVSMPDLRHFVGAQAPAIRAGLPPAHTSPSDKS